MFAKKRAKGDCTVNCIQSQFSFKQIKFYHFKSVRIFATTYNFSDVMQRIFILFILPIFFIFGNTQVIGSLEIIHCYFDKFFSAIKFYPRMIANFFMLMDI
uniref:Uncharacterized protein n=1 Tax=Latrodectus hesperus TaxID=256737 RepID=E7D1S3_LATHE|nr:hypothetical protein [Latrodectus hesperus]ADV40318.1 hypothetical protein [Latrodectus hesperus]